MWNTRYMKAHKVPEPKEWADLESMAVTTKRTAVLLYRLSRHPRKEPL